MDYSEYNKTKEGYYDDALHKGNSIQKFWHLFRFKEVQKQITKKSVILDVGCGPGSMLAFLSLNIKEGIGIDVAEKQIEFAKNKFKNNKKLKWIHGNANTIKIKQKVDCVIAGELIEHLKKEDISVLLDSIKKILKKNGRLIITTPNYNSFWPIIEIILSKIGPIDYTKQHITRLNIKKIKRILNIKGFKIKKIKTFYIISPFLAPINKKLARSIKTIEEKLFPCFGNEMLIVAEI